MMMIPWWYAWFQFCGLDMKARTSKVMMSSGPGFPFYETVTVVWAQRNNADRTADRAQNCEEVYQEFFFFGSACRLSP